MNTTGQTAFFHFLDGSGVDDSNRVGVWIESSNRLSLAARTGNPAPGTIEGVNFGQKLSVFPSFNSAGQTAFFATLVGSGVTPDNNQGIWSGSPDALSLLARSGTHAPGMPIGVTFGGFREFAPELADSGEIGFQAYLAGDGINSTNNTSNWVQRAGGLTLIARTGAQAPGLPAGVHFSEFGGYVPVFDGAGRATFWARLSSPTDQSIWSERSGNLALVVRTGDSAPGAPTGATFTSVIGPGSSQVNDAGLIVMHALIAGALVDSSNDAGIWSEGSGSLALVAREGDLAAGASDGASFSSFSLRPVLNDEGQTAFYATLRGSEIDDTNDGGIWATDRAGVLQLIARKGDALEVAPGDFRTISSFQVDLTDGPAFNDAGQVAFHAAFSDGTYGVFVSNAVAISEPRSLLLAALALLAIFLLRRASSRIGKQTRLCAGLLTPHRSWTAGLLVSLSPLLLDSPSAVRADIVQWE
jgi:hypothetical protein